MAIRLATWGGRRTTLHALLEIATFLVVVVIATLRSERRLLHEFRGYLKGRSVGIRSAIETQGA
jgi:hypothetical protein